MSGLDPEIQLPITLPLDDHSGPAARVSQDHLQSMVAAALVEFDHVQAHEKTDNEKSDNEKTNAVSPKRVPTPWLVAAGATLALVGSIAAARYVFFTPAPKQLPAIQTPVAAPQPPAAEPARPELLPPAAADSADNTDDSELDDSVPDEGADSARSTDRGRRALTRSTTAPEDLLQKANQLRAAGRFRNAAQTYSLVYDRFPKTPAAYVARVAAGSLELEHLSNPLKARKLFELALQDRPKGALDLEARQGLSVALRDLEDRAGERDALRTLVSHHPGSPAARRAQVRLMELGGE
jgi:hypothetical protein